MARGAGRGAWPAQVLNFPPEAASCPVYVRAPSRVGLGPLKMGKLPEQNDIPPWVGAPEVLKEPGVFQVQTGLLEAVFRE